MLVFVPIFLVLCSLGSIWLGIFLSGELRNTLESGVVGTMRGKTSRSRKPLQYWLLVAANALFILMAFTFPLIAAMRLILY
jgi:hypothetical protein